MIIKQFNPRLRITWTALLTVNIYKKKLKPGNNYYLKLLLTPLKGIYVISICQFDRNCYLQLRPRLASNQNCIVPVDDSSLEPWIKHVLAASF